MPAKPYKPDPLKVHPIWRGIGCGLMVIIPIISFGIADMALPLVDDQLPEILTQALEAPGDIQIQAFWGRFLFTALISVVLFLAFTIIGSILYSLMGGPRQEENIAFSKRNKFRR